MSHLRDKHQNLFGRKIKSTQAQRASANNKAKKDRFVQNKRVKRGEGQHGLGTAQYSEQALHNAVQQLSSSDSSARSAAVKQLRLILTVEEPPIDLFLQLNIVPKLVPFLSLNHDNMNVQDMKEALWIIANMASGSVVQTEAVMDFVPILVQIISAYHKDPTVLEPAVWALGNMAGEHGPYRQQMVAAGVLPVLRACLDVEHPEATSEVVRTAAWAVYNLARSIPYEVLEPFHFEHALEAQLVVYSQGQFPSKYMATLSELLWLLSMLTMSRASTSAFTLPPILNTLSVVITTAQLTSHNEVQYLVLPCVRALGNYASHSDDVVTKLLQFNGLAPRLIELLHSDSRAVTKESAYLISNIVAGTDQHRHAMVQHGIVKALSEIMSSSTHDIKKEAGYAIMNLASNQALVHTLVNAQVVTGMLKMMQAPDLDGAVLALDFVETVLKIHPEGADIIERANGIEALEKLQYDDSTPVGVAERAGALVDEYYSDIPEEDMTFEDQGPLPPWRKQ